MRALLFLDVDGTLLPFGAGPYPLYEPRFGPSTVATGRPPDGSPGALTGHPLLTRVNPAFGARLTSLGCELVWATTWGEDANTGLAPWLGLPRLPLVDWPDRLTIPHGLSCTGSTTEWGSPSGTSRCWRSG